MTYRPSGVSSHPIIFYDGVCGLCDGLVQFVLKHDRDALFRFAPLQGEHAHQVLRPRGHDPAALNTVYVIDGDRVYARADAVLYVLRRSGPPWRVLSALGVLPASLLDMGYRLVARFRYLIFGKYQACPVPRPEWSERFIA